VRHVCRVDNAWENVSAGSVGNAGAPGPAGFANDPQAVSYRPQLLDGNASLLDWSWLDGSVNSSSNPINTSTGEWTIPASTGANQWYFGQPVLYSTSGTPPAGLKNNTLYFVNPSGLSSAQDPTRVTLYTVPWNLTLGASPVVPTTQGSGPQNFSFWVWHTHWQNWYTVAQDGRENWTSGTSRNVSPLYPAFVASEKAYWEQSGAIPPIDFNQPFTPQQLNTGNWLSFNYNPLSRVNVTGGNGGGIRPEIGLISEWAFEAFMPETPASWDKMRVFDLAGAAYPYTTLLNEATGRIPALNNGPPTGPRGNGTGASYAPFDAPQKDRELSG
jgi:hypothetical protein